MLLNNFADSVILPQTLVEFGCMYLLVTYLMITFLQIYYVQFYSTLLYDSLNPLTCLMNEVM